MVIKNWIIKYISVKENFKSSSNCFEFAVFTTHISGTKGKD